MNDETYCRQTRNKKKWYFSLTKKRPEKLLNDKSLLSHHHLSKKNLLKTVKRLQKFFKATFKIQGEYSVFIDLLEIFKDSVLTKNTPVVVDNPYNVSHNK